MKVSGINETMRMLQDAVDRTSKEKLVSESNNLVNALKANTPVDTGAARDNWKVSRTGDSAVISNDRNYISELNGGSSQQAPAHFIEKTVLENRNVISNGTIVEYT